MVMFSVPVASMYKFGDDCVTLGLTTSNANVYVMLGWRIASWAKVRINAPLVQCPALAVTPSANKSSPSVPASIKLTGFVAMIEPGSPEIVTLVPFAASNCLSQTRVTVNLLVAPATGVLCPIRFVVNSALIT